jgi:hypothetical protein
LDGVSVPPRRDAAVARSCRLCAARRGVGEGAGRGNITASTAAPIQKGARRSDSGDEKWQRTIVHDCARRIWYRHPAGTITASHATCDTGYGCVPLLSMSRAAM